MIVIVIVTAGTLQVFLIVDLMANLKITKTEPSIAFTILSPTKTKEIYVFLATGNILI